MKILLLILTALAISCTAPRTVTVWMGGEFKEMRLPAGFHSDYEEGSDGYYRAVTRALVPGMTEEQIEEFIFSPIQ